MTVHMTIELDEAEEAQLRAIADHEHLSPETVIKKLLSERLGRRRWLQAIVEEGRAAVARGEVMDQDEVFAQLEQRMAKTSRQGG